MVPLLVLWARYSQREAHAASLGAIVPISAAGALTFGAAGEVRLGYAIALAVGAVARRPGRSARARAGSGAHAQARLRRLPRARRGRDGGAGLSSVALLLLLLAVGITSGMLAGLLGVGGGVLLVPFLVLAVGMSQHEAEATSLLVVLPTAIVASLILHRRGVGDLPRLAGGRRRSARRNGGRTRRPVAAGRRLRTVFAVFLGLIGLRLVRDAMAGRA